MQRAQSHHRGARTQWHRGCHSDSARQRCPGEVAQDHPETGSRAPGRSGALGLGAHPQPLSDTRPLGSLRCALAPAGSLAPGPGNRETEPAETQSFRKEPELTAPVGNAGQAGGVGLDRLEHGLCDPGIEGGRQALPGVRSAALSGQRSEQGKF